MDDEITRESLERSLRGLEDSTSEDLQKTKAIGISALSAIGVAAVGVAYTLGRRRSGKEKTYVEVQRVT